MSEVNLQTASACMVIVPADVQNLSTRLTGRALMSHCLSQVEILR